MQNCQITKDGCDKSTRDAGLIIAIVGGGSLILFVLWVIGLICGVIE